VITLTSVSIRPGISGASRGWTAPANPWQERGRLIMHLDMDGYFASVEQQANPALRGRPVGVTGRPTDKSIIVAASREAKARGVRSGMPVWEARKFCPELVLTSGNGNRYRETTKRFLTILETYTPYIEVFSIDEVFMNVTHQAATHGGPVEMATRIKAAFRQQLGRYITATIGIASGKVFAKWIGSQHKPDGIGWLDNEEIPEMLSTTPVVQICGIGRRMEARLARLGIRTLAELGASPETLLRREFGVTGCFLKAVGQGHDPNPVIPSRDVQGAKSVGHSRSLRPELRTMDNALVILRGLCDKVARRLRRQSYVGRTVHCWYRNLELTGTGGKQTTLAVPTDDGPTIYRACLDILDALPQRPDAVSKIGVTVRGLEQGVQRPLKLLAQDHRQDRLNGAIDQIRDRFGEEAIRTADALLFKPIPDHVSGFTLTQQEWED